MNWLRRAIAYKRHTYRKKGVYFIRARMPRRGFPVDIQVWAADSDDVGYRYRGLMPWELRQILECGDTQTLGYVMFSLAHKAHGEEK